MAILGNFRNAFVSVNAINLSDHVRSSTFPRSAEDLDSTAMGATSRRKLAGLLTGTFEVEFNQDYAVGSVDATLRVLLGAAPFPVAWRPDAGAISTSNPEFQFNAILTNYESGGTVGDMAVCRATFAIDGDVTVDVTP